MKSEISILAFPDFSAPPPPCAFLMFCVRICAELAPLAAVNVRRCGSRDVARGEGVRVCGGGVIVLARQLSPTPAAARPPAGRHHPWGGGPKGPFFGRCERKHKIYIEKNKKKFFYLWTFFLTFSKKNRSCEGYPPLCNTVSAMVPADRRKYFRWIVCASSLLPQSVCRMEMALLACAGMVVTVAFKVSLGLFCCLVALFDKDSVDVMALSCSETLSDLASSACKSWLSPLPPLPMVNSGDLTLQLPYRHQEKGLITIFTDL